MDKKENKNSKVYKVLSVIFGIGIFVCFFGFAISGFLGLFWLIPICFIGFPLCAILSGVFSSLASTKKTKSNTPTGSAINSSAMANNSINNVMITCEYCGSRYHYRKGKCPQCGATNSKDKE